MDSLKFTNTASFEDLFYLLSVLPNTALPSDWQTYLNPFYNFTLNTALVTRSPLQTRFSANDTFASKLGLMKVLMKIITPQPPLFLSLSIYIYMEVVVV